MKLVNLTKHPINIILKNGRKYTLEPSKNPVRVEDRQKLINSLKPDYGPEIPLYTEDYSQLTQNPPKKEGTYYIVSRITAQVSGREDFLCPAKPVHDENGNLKGCKGFLKLNHKEGLK